MSTMIDETKDLSQKVLSQISEQPGVQLSAVLPGTNRNQVKQIIADLTQKGEISEELFMDYRILNSRAGQGGGTTNFNVFWEKCNEIIHNQEGSAAHERRQGAHEHDPGLGRGAIRVGRFLRSLR